MNNVLSPDVLELLSWIASCPRTYAETMEAWRTSCPRHSAWEDALSAGFIRVESSGREVKLTSRGRAVLSKP